MVEIGSINDAIHKRGDGGRTAWRSSASPHRWGAGHLKDEMTEGGFLLVAVKIGRPCRRKCPGTVGRFGDSSGGGDLSPVAVILSKGNFLGIRVQLVKISCLAELMPPRLAPRSAPYVQPLTSGIWTIRASLPNSRCCHGKTTAALGDHPLHNYLPRSSIIEQQPGLLEVIPRSPAHGQSAPQNFRLHIGRTNRSSSAGSTLLYLIENQRTISLYPLLQKSKPRRSTICHLSFSDMTTKHEKQVLKP